VASSPWSVIDCGGTCSASYGRGTIVTLTARPEGESSFVGWGGPCAGTGPCSVTIDAAKTVTAQFKAPDREVVVEMLGRGQGTVTSVPAGLRCPPACATTFPGQSQLELKASARSGSRFTAWSQDCSGRTCSLTLDRDKYVLATFADVQAPRVRALPSRGLRGGLARLRYRVSENTGVARVTIRVGRRSIRTRFRRLAATRTYSARWRIPRSASAGASRFCVRASDRSRHTSGWSCARLTIR
jgi:List-Bact-rpt repeat protein